MVEVDLDLTDTSRFVPERHTRKKLEGIVDSLWVLLALNLKISAFGKQCPSELKQLPVSMLHSRLYYTRIRGTENSVLGSL